MKQNHEWNTVKFNNKTRILGVRLNKFNNKTEI